LEVGRLGRPVKWQFPAMTLRAEHDLGHDRPPGEVIADPLRLSHTDAQGQYLA
jgi:hypothetical protein